LSEVVLLNPGPDHGLWLVNNILNYFHLSITTVCHVNHTTKDNEITFVALTKINNISFICSKDYAVILHL